MSAPSLIRTSVCNVLVALLAAIAVIASESRALAATAIVTTDSGPVEGLVTTAMTEFLGIPFAAPPTGDLRWQPPQPPTPWTTPRDATVFGNHCPQAFSPFGLETDTEDCLVLNVYVPVHRGFPADARRHRPVMVWIHGGAFSVGESDVYDPARLVAQDVTVVTINYRLGALGFLAHPALTAESPDGISGNYGLLDQQAALRWVQRNIASFGGSPHRVTIFGESAGGFSVHAHLASPLAAGLFQRAIVESGAFFTQPTLAAAEPTGTAFAIAVGCSDQTAACLRAAPVDQILANWGTGLSSTTPVIDGVVLPQPLRNAFARGEFNRVPIIEGSNQDEFRLFVALLYDLVSAPLTADQYDAAVASLLQIPLDFAAAITSHYPGRRERAPNPAAGELPVRRGAWVGDSISVQPPGPVEHSGTHERPAAARELHAPLLDAFRALRQAAGRAHATLAEANRGHSALVAGADAAAEAAKLLQLRSPVQHIVERPARQLSAR